MLKVILSNGHFKFILGTAAAEAYKRNILAGYITAGYPSRSWKKFIELCRLSNYSIFQRLLGRQEDIPDGKVYSLWLTEIIMQFGMFIRKAFNSSNYPEKLGKYAMRLYGRQASYFIKNYEANIYHYRSGYGYTSVRIAKKMGMHILCDHSIAHPAVLEYLINNDGKMPPINLSLDISPYWGWVLDDINQAADVVVNSKFVKDTFINRGWKEENVHVIYIGIENDFLRLIPPRKETHSESPLTFLFAGEFGPRKGAQQLIDAFQRIKDLEWRLEIAGNIDKDIKHQNPDFFNDERIKLSGYLSRKQLAIKMAESEVFIFPSLAEGSARVIFMAMACGCYIITTPNSGSIVEHGVHGLLVNAGDIEGLSLSIRNVAVMDRNEINAIGENNSCVIRSKYTQQHYGNDLFELYQSLLKKNEQNYDNYQF